MKRFTKSQRLYLYQFCADMITANLPLYDSVTKLQREGRVLLGGGFAKKLQLFLDKMATTESVAGVFEDFVPRQELSVIYSSEKSGSLADGFLGIVKMINFRNELRAKLLRAITFPLIMIVLALIVVAGYAIKVFPAFAQVIPPERWPTVTQWLYYFGNSLYDGLWITILAVFIALVFIVRFVMMNVGGNLRNHVLDRIIPFSTYKKMSASLFLNNLSSMLRNSIPLNESLNIIQLNANRWLRGHVLQMQNNMAMGLPYGNALNTGLLSGNELLNISLYADLPSFFDVLLSVSEKSNKDIEINMQWLAGFLKSLSTLVLGGCVVWIFIALFALSNALSASSFS